MRTNFVRTRPALGRGREWDRDRMSRGRKVWPRCHVG